MHIDDKLLTKDAILNGKVTLFQPKDGYRVSMDPIILSHFVNVIPNQRVLDVGAGNGVISLILKFKEPSLSITAIDIDKFMCDICKKNADINNCDLQVINENIKNNPIKGETFDCVVTNPPFFPRDSSRISDKKSVANFETVSLSQWLDFCLKKLSNGGWLYVIHDASRIDCILSSLFARAGDITIIPIMTKPHTHAKRVIVKCKKGSRSASKIEYGITIHSEDGSFTKIANDILQMS